ncbi:MAG: Hsp20/alpha crystallin family protein [Phycisphaerales bacterium]|nr:Hsp20/alpha crystallin family protein [Phycisphaerales bacterium]
MSIKVQVKNNIDRTVYTETKGFSRNGYSRNGSFGLDAQTGVSPTTNCFAGSDIWSGADTTYGQFSTPMFNQFDAIDPTLTQAVSKLNSIDPIFVTKLNRIAGSCQWTTQKFIKIAMQDMILAKALLIVAQRNLHLAGQWAAQALVNPTLIRQQLQIIGLPILNVVAINSLFNNLQAFNTISGSVSGIAGSEFSGMQTGLFATQVNSPMDGLGTYSSAMLGNAPASEVAPMKVDIFDDGGTYILEAEVPGAVSEDVDVTIQDGKLIIEAVCSRSGFYAGSKRSLLREKSFNKIWRREFNVGQDIDVRDISASMAGGILKLVLPKMSIADALTVCQAA